MQFNRAFVIYIYITWWWPKIEWSKHVVISNKANWKAMYISLCCVRLYMINWLLPISMYYSTCNITLSLLNLLLPTLFPWNFGTQVKSIYSPLLQFTTACKWPMLSPINLQRGHTENTSCGRYPLLCDITAYAEVCLLSRCLETGCINPLFHHCSAQT
jgi:hypothetical protein